MKSLLLTLILIITIFLQSYSQVKESPQNLKQQAINMGLAFLRGDYKTFANYTYPLILKSMGGSAKMDLVLSKSTNDMKAQSMYFTNITFEEPTKIIKSGKELQATIAQHTEIKLSKGRLIVTSTLIAISIDNGINWTFIDTSNKDMVTLRKALPNISPLITIPKQQPPVKYNL